MNINKQGPSVYRTELIELVAEAKAIMKVEPELYTEATRIALQSQVDRAEQVLRGTYEIPFVRNRQYVVPRDDEDIQFVTEHQTIHKPSDSTAKFGLKPLLAWYKTQHVYELAAYYKEQANDPSPFGALCSHVKGLAEDLLMGATPGEAIGQYAAEAINLVKETLRDMDEALHNSYPAYEIGTCVVKVFNAMRAMRYAQVFRSDIEPQSSLFFEGQSLQVLRDKINHHDVFKQEYHKLKAMSDEMSLADIQQLKVLLDENDDRASSNEQYKLWSTVKNQNFHVPEGTAYAKLSICLPAEENEQEGHGHVWIDNISIFSASGGYLPIKNASFEQGTDAPDYWRPVSKSGAPVMKWEDRNHYVYDGERSLYIENPTPDDCGVWEYTENLPIEQGAYTLSYYVKNDHLFKEGVQVVIAFKDEHGMSVAEQYVSINNHHSCYGPGGFNLTFQADALIYAVTGDKTYAQKAKERMMWFANDHLQGIEHWLIYKSRPYGSDSYGAVQAGRNAASLASAYSLIKDADVFTEAEYEYFLRQIDYWLHDLLDLRDRTELGPYYAQKDTGNWETDMCIGAAMLALAFGDDIPHARQWLHNGIVVIEGQLKYTLRADGGWPESIRYHFAVLNKLAAFGKALRHGTGRDWFAGNSYLKKMFAFAVEVQTPPYSAFGYRTSTPNFGDHEIGDGKEFGVLGLYVDEIAATDPELAARVHQTWVRAGRPFRPYWGESMAIENFFASYDDDDSEQVPLRLSSSDFARSWGMFQFRHHFDTEQETYLALMANEKPLGHHHHDQGSFILYSNKVPLVMDPGVEGYFDTSRRWYGSSAAHSVVQFLTEGQYTETPRTSEQGAFFTNDELDVVSVIVAHPDGQAVAKQTRHVAYVKKDIEAFIVWDHIEGDIEGSRFNIPIAAISSTIDHQVIESMGHFHMDLQTTVLQPAEAMITQEFARSFPHVPPIDGLHQLNFVRIEASKGEHFLTIFYPKHRDRPGLVSKRLACNGHAQAYLIQDADEHGILLFVNNGEQEQVLQLTVTSPFVDLQDGRVWDNGAIEIAGQSIRMMRLMK